MSAPGLSITQMNLHHSKGTSAVLQRYMTAMHRGISLIQEPQLVTDTIRGLEGRGGGLVFVTGSPRRPNQGPAYYRKESTLFHC